MARKQSSHSPADQAMSHEGESKKTSRKTGPHDSAGRNATRQKDGKFLAIVGLGASAGGLEAFEQFFKNMPAETGMAFVLVPHLDPGHSSMMPDLLKRFTRMKVLEAADGMRVEADHAYVIPPNKDMAIYHGALQLTQPARTRGLRMPIDFFLRSLAEDQGDKAICVILSGTGTDGSMGVRAIHGAGGMIMVQEVDTAKYEGMPKSALDTGLADFVLPVEKMPEQLTAYVEKISSKKTRPISVSERAPTSLQKVLMTLRSRTGRDFSLYKKSTIYRRVEKRMDVHNLEDLGHYVRYLHDHPEEVQVLFKELLIGVTSFFRDPGAFDVLKKKIFPRLLEDKPEDYLVRVWVPGCATGEEAYSIACVFREYMDQAKKELKLQLFGTDIDEEAVRQARVGAYPDNIAIDVTPERLKRFFVKDESGLRIKKEVRESAVFAVQSLIKDAPFTKLDLISCRNLLIYLEPELQNRLLPLFQYSLKPGGVLFLGTSESIGKFSDLFITLDKKWKFFRRREAAAQASVLPDLPWAFEPARETEGDLRKPKKPNIAELAQNELLEAFVPPSVIVNDKGDIVYFHGQTGVFLAPSPGKPSLNLMDMAREGLRFEVGSALHSAASRKKEVKHTSLRVKSNHEWRMVDLAVKPLGPQMEGLFLVTFQEVVPPPQVKEKAAVSPRKPLKKEERKIAELEQELAYTKESLQATIEELQAANEEMRSTNEEFQSTNEELQSTNEELETSKEELQSVNEELVTVNSELQAKIDQVSHTENDMKAFLDNINIGAIFLDTELGIKRFTFQATRVFNLIPTDVGRPISHIRSTLKYDDVTRDARQVLETLQTREMEMETMDGRWYLMRIMPSRTAENVIDGVVATFTEITQLKEAKEDVAHSRDRLSDILEGISDGFFHLNREWKFTYINRAAEKLWNRNRQEMLDRSLWDYAPQSDDAPFYQGLKKAMEEKIPVAFEDHSFEEDRPMEVRAFPYKEGLTVYFHEIRAGKEPGRP